MKRSQVILLVTAFVLLLASFSSAVVISSSTDISNQDYGGTTLQFSANTQQITVTLSAVTISKSPLYIAGKDSGASATDAPVLLNYVSGVLYQPIEFASLLPSNSILSFTNLYASTPAKTSVFIFRSTALLFNTTVNIFSITASWDTRDSVASLVEANTIFTIQERSALYINNVKVVKSAHVFSASLSSTLRITNYGVLAVDNANCTSCSSSLILVNAVMYVSGSSMFRASNDYSNANPLLDHEGDVTLLDKSLYFVSQCATSSGRLFSGPGTLTTSSDSVSTLSNVTSGITGFTSASPITFTYVYLLTVSGVRQDSAATCLTNGIKVASYFDTAVPCTMSQCIPGTTITATSNNNKCTCGCQDKFNQLACTITPDPLSSTTTALSECKLPNCKRCSSVRLTWCSECTCPNRLHDGVCTLAGDAEPNCLSLYDNGFCKQCATGYQLSDDYRCLTCNVDNCQKCYDNNLCSVCKSGYSAGANGACYSTQA